MNSADPWPGYRDGVREGVMGYYYALEQGRRCVEVCRGRGAWMDGEEGSVFFGGWWAKLGLRDVWLGGVYTGDGVIIVGV